MDIESAKQQVKDTITAYLSRHDNGAYRIPFEMQRPIFLEGPPGVGKTAIVKQAAQECGINFLSYSMTHHTRQSALGLPRLVEREYEGKTYTVSEYTMSEIIASVHDSIKRTGIAQGVLLLDEVNCVSETLAPAMLQFLQFKTLGQHALPHGWIVVAAGNPTEFNRAARRFDAATLDRLKRIEVEPDVDAWLDYAAQAGVHPAITSYLQCKPDRFYLVRPDAGGTRLVTARGWEDLSRMLQTCEHELLSTDESLMRQYLQDEETAIDFATYYNLFCEYRQTLDITGILAGTVQEGEQELRDARFDKKIALTGMLYDALLVNVRDAMQLEEALRIVRNDLLDCKSADRKGDLESALAARIASANDGGAIALAKQKLINNPQMVQATRVALLYECLNAVRTHATNDSAAECAFNAAKAPFNAACEHQRAMAQNAVAQSDAAFAFMDRAFGRSQEALVFVARASADPAFIMLVSEWGGDGYFSHSKSLKFNERGLDLARKVELVMHDDEGAEASANLELDEEDR